MSVTAASQGNMDLSRHGKRGLLVFIHGGYCARRQVRLLYVRRRSSPRASTVRLINYDLCPGRDIALSRVRNAITWLLKEGRGHGLAAHNIVISGHSRAGI